MSLFRQRRQEHREDEAQRLRTAETISQHRTKLKRVRRTLNTVDETLGDEIRRLDAMLNRGSTNA